MGLHDLAQRDAQMFLNNTGDFGFPVLITAPGGGSSLELKGYHVKHYTGFDIDGVRVNSKNASVVISEKDLIAAGYPYRTADGEVSLLEHTIVAKDLTTTDKTFVVRENYPDETLGIIVLILGDY